MKLIAGLIIGFALIMLAAWLDQREWARKFKEWKERKGGV